MFPTFHFSGSSLIIVSERRRFVFARMHTFLVERRFLADSLLRVLILIRHTADSLYACNACVDTAAAFIDTAAAFAELRDNY